MKSIFFFVVLLASSSYLFGQTTEAVRQKHFLVEDGVAIQEYDPITYFESKKPKEGSKEHAYTYKGLTYYFVNEGNLNKFKENPAKYEPAYGGWCAYAIAAKGNKMEPDPETFKIVDGKLLLFYNGFFNNTLKTWNEDEPKYKKKADEKWEMIIEE